VCIVVVAMDSNVMTARQCSVESGFGNTLCFIVDALGGFRTDRESSDYSSETMRKALKIFFKSSILSKICNTELTL